MIRNERGVGVGMLVNQLPPTELARLKAELAETLIANFCYPRFFDYRTDSLRTRPVDRAKRQEVWQFLSSVDFNAWGRIDVMSPDLQHQVERLFIHFVQRNRTFFGEQGRKRMTDVRMLIDSASLSVIEGLRGHLTGRQAAGRAFGSPWPVTSWSATSRIGQSEPDWDQVNATAIQLQQQLQEVRGENKANDARLHGVPARRSIRSRSTVNGNSTVEPEVMPYQRIAANKPAPQGEAPTVQSSKTTNPLTSPAASVPAPVAPPVHKIERVVVSEDVVTPYVPAPSKSAGPAAPPVRAPERIQHPAAPPLKVQVRDLPQAAKAPMMEVSPGTAGSSTVLVGDEDMMIFEQLQHQLVTWLRVEAVSAGLDISGQSATQLLEMLRQQDGFDETRLQVVSTLLNLSDQIIATGQAGLLEYKQAMMFYLMHTRRTR
jgi:hypothetical protein